MFQFCEYSNVHLFRHQALLTMHMIEDIANFHLLVIKCYFFLVYISIYLFIIPFWRTLRHIVGSKPGKCSLGCSVLQSAIGKDVLSKGSAHLGSPSERHTQHLIESPMNWINKYWILFQSLIKEDSNSPHCDG